MLRLTPKRLHFLEKYGEHVQQNRESLLKPDIRRLASIKPSEPSGHVAAVSEYCDLPQQTGDFEVEDSIGSHTANNNGSYPVEQSERHLKKVIV